MKREITFLEALREGLKEEMSNNSNIILMGEDIKINIWGVTRNFADEFGDDRIIQMPISENGFCAVAVGASLTGIRPVVELMYGDFLLVAADAICNQAAKLRYMSGNQYFTPVTFRVAGSGIGSRGGAHHSQNLEAFPLHFPGLKIVYPLTPYEAKGFIKTAIRDDNPVLFFEHKLLYTTKGYVPDSEYTIPLGEGIIRREGKDMTVVSYGHMCNVVLEAAKEIYEEDGIDIEVYDPRSLRPFDSNMLFNSLKKTGCLLIVEEDTKIGGVGAEIAADVAENALYYLEAPIKRVCGYEAPVPSGEYGHSHIIPGKKEILKAIRDIVRQRR